jgi:phosphoglycerate dehydrogenase-like enzyme
MKKNLTVLVSLTLSDKARSMISQACENVEIRLGDWINDVGQTLPPEIMKGVDILICEMPPENFDDFDQLKWVQLTSAGYSQVFDLPILERGIRVTNGRGNFDTPIAEWNIMMMLLWHRRMLDMLQNQKSCIWDRTAKFQQELRGSRVGFYGYGGIARQTARLAKAMGLEVWAMTPDGKTKKRDRVYCVEGTGDPEGTLPDRLFSLRQDEEFFGNLDYLIITSSLTETTRGAIGEKQLRMLKPSAVLINPARAQMIDEQIYIKCLRENWIRGSSLDVHYAYPLPPEHPLWLMPNIIMTPHISGSVECPYFFDRVYDVFSQNLKRYCNDQPLINELSPEQIRGQ